MRKNKIYLDTSIISFIFADDSPEFREFTIDFFEDYSRDFDLYISEIVLLEINNNSNENLKIKMLESIEKYNIKKLEYNEEIDEIAKNYILNKIIPENKIEDSLHVAYATYYEIDILLSWNFKHLANIKKEQKILIENMKMGYNYPLRLLSPLEVQNEE
jgi:predicted nucleic acid-binding protein